MAATCLIKKIRICPFVYKTGIGQTDGQTELVKHYRAHHSFHQLTVTKIFSVFLAKDVFVPKFRFIGLLTDDKNGVYAP